MKYILKRLLIFSIPVLLATSSLEFLVRGTPNNYTQKKAFLEAQLGEIETLILGSSHSYAGINPDSLDGEAFNLAAAAQTLYFDKFLLQKYIDSLPKLKTVILPISYPSLGGESDRHPGDLDRSYHYATFYGSRKFINPLAPRLYSRVSLFTTKDAVDRVLKHYVHQESIVNFGENGWRGVPKKSSKIATEGRSTAKMHDHFYGDDLVPLNIERIEQIIETCKERGVTLIFVSMPMYPSYVARVRPERFDKMFSVMNSISQEHKLPYYDFTCDERFRKSHFFDSTHLRTKGANKFTQILNELIQLHSNDIADISKVNEGI